MKAACAPCVVVFCRLVVACVLSLTLPFSPASAAELWIGAASADITPDPPVAQEGVNIATSIRDRCTANVLALESRQGERILDQAVLVSCDLCILPGVQEGFRQYLAARQPGFDINKLSLAATHTHTSPMVLKSPYNDKDYGKAVQPKDYLPFLYQRMGDAVTKAWATRGAGAVAWGLGHAVVGHNRRVTFHDGTAKMHGNTNNERDTQLSLTDTRHKRQKSATSRPWHTSSPYGDQVHPRPDLVHYPNLVAGTFS